MSDHQMANAEVEQFERRAFYHKLLITAGLVYTAWGILLIFVRPNLPNFVAERILFGAAFIGIFLFRERLEKNLILITQIVSTLCVIDFAFMTARSGAQASYLFGMIIMAVGFFFAFINDVKAFLIHALCVIASFIGFAYLYGVLGESSDYIRQICLIYFVMYWVARAFDRHTKAISTLREERSQLLEQQKAKVVENLKSVQSVFTALSSEKAKLPENINLRIFYRPAEETGGDWVCHHYSEERNWLILIVGDVTGHDLGSSLVTVAAAAATRSAFESRINIDAELDAFMLNIAKSTHSAVRFSGNQNKRMTAAFVGIDLKNKHGVCINCSHPPMILSGPDKVNFLTTGPSTPLGYKEFLPQTKKFDLERVQSILLFTDGLTDNTQKRISDKNLLRKMAPGRASYELLAEEVKDFAPEDDVTFLTLELK